MEANIRKKILAEYATCKEYQRKIEDRSLVAGFPDHSLLELANKFCVKCILNNYTDGITGCGDVHKKIQKLETWRNL